MTWSVLASNNGDTARNSKVMEAIPVSIIVMTKNEERNLAKCLRTLARFDEVFVVDSDSTDKTVAIAEEMGAKVIDFRWNGGYPKKKQWCLENLPFRHDWVLYVDADEEVYAELAEEIARLMRAGPKHAGYFIAADFRFIGKVLRHGHSNCKLALLDRHRTCFREFDDLDAANMWEVEGHYQPHVNGTVGIMKSRMLHSDDKTLFHYFDRHNRYSDWEAVVRRNAALASSQETQLAGRRVLKQMFNAMPFKGLLAFVHSYFLRLGFLDGAPGFHFAMARGFYYWQVGIKCKERRN